MANARHPSTPVCAAAIFLLAIIRLGVADNVTATVKSSDSSDSSTDANASTTGTDYSTISRQKADGTPHFWQRDPRGGFANEGRDYCCPVAVSDSFVYFARNGFPALLGAGDGDQPQIDLINLLASSDYFGTDPENGTSPGQVLFGVQKYVTDKGYHCERLEYEGWRDVGKREQSTVLANRPNLAWLKAAIDNPKGTAWLNIGWYVQGDKDNEWKRVGGHWVTLVGYRAPGPNDDGETFLIHNSLTRGNSSGPDALADDTVQLTAVDDGILHVGKGATQSTTGIYQLSGPGLPVAKTIDAAFLDAAIVMVIGQ